MAGDPRRSTRPIKIRTDQNFVYDEESLKILNNRLEISTTLGEQRQLSPSLSESAVKVGNPVLPSIAGVLSSQEIPVIDASLWTDVFPVPHLLDNVSEDFNVISHTSIFSPNVAQASVRNVRVDKQISGRFSVDPRKSLSEGVRLRRSSTRLDYLDYSFDSVSQTRSIFSGMDNSDIDEQVRGKSRCECIIGSSCQVCRAEVEGFSPALGTAAVSQPLRTVEREPTNTELMTLMTRALEKMEAMQVDLRSSRHDINAIQFRLQSLEAGSRAGSVRQTSQAGSQSSQGEVEFSVGATDEEVVIAQQNKLKKAKSAKDKKDRIEEEKARGLKVMRDQLRDRGRTDSTSQAEGNGSAASSIFELGEMRKKLSKKQKKVCDQKVSSRISEVGAVFPAEESSNSGSSSSSSGTDSESGSRSRSRRKRKVK